MGLLGVLLPLLISLGFTSSHRLHLRLTIDLASHSASSLGATNSDSNSKRGRLGQRATASVAAASASSSALTSTASTSTSVSDSVTATATATATSAATAATAAAHAKSGAGGWFEPPVTLPSGFAMMRATVTGVELRDTSGVRTMRCPAASPARARGTLLHMDFHCDEHTDTRFKSASAAATARSGDGAGARQVLRKGSRINPFSFYPGPSPDASGPIPGSQTWKPTHGAYLHGQFPYKKYNMEKDGVAACNDMAQSNNQVNGDCKNPIGPFMWHKQSEVSNSKMT